MTRNEALARLRTWLAAHNPAVDAAAVGDETDIIDGRILESLQLIEFILFIEQESGKEILREELDPKRLRTLATIYREFFDG
jgi:acyl carrier protein